MVVLIKRLEAFQIYAAGMLFVHNRPGWPIYVEMASKGEGASEMLTLQGFTVLVLSPDPYFSAGLDAG